MIDANTTSNKESLSYATDMMQWDYLKIFLKLCETIILKIELNMVK